MEPREEVSQLYREARADVYRYAITMGLPPAHAQDLVQETFLRLYERRLAGETIREPRAWIFRVAHNLALTDRRRERAADPLDASSTTPSAPGPGPEEELISRQRTARMKQAVAGLSPQQKQVLELRAGGLRYREIAEIMGIGVSTVFEFVSRAVARLRKALDE